MESYRRWTALEVAPRSRTRTSSILLQRFCIYSETVPKTWTEKCWPTLISGLSRFAANSIWCCLCTSATDRPGGYTNEEAAKVEERLQALAISSKPSKHPYV